MSSGEVARVIAAWRPARWPEAEMRVLVPLLGVVRDWVAVATPPSATVARRLLLRTAGLAVWAHREIGTAAAATVLVPENVAYWADVVCARRPATWRRDARRSLEWVGRAANPGGWPPPTMPGGRRDVRPPYAERAEATWRLAAMVAMRGGRSGHGWVVCAALGAGLRGPEIATARAADLSELDGRLVVRVAGAHPRHVPIRRPYLELAERVADVGSGRLIGCTDRNGVHRIVESLGLSGGECLSLPRCRNTWLAAHLAAGTPLGALRRLAGPVSMNTLDALLVAIAATLDHNAALALGSRA